MSRLVFCSKSRWYPPIRREHALAQQARESGHDVVFIERPHDMRVLKSSGRRVWLRQLAAGDGRSEDGIRVVSRSAVAPGHRGRAAEAFDTLAMRSVLHRLGGDVIVASVPWEWPAVSRQGGRRVFDCADDWSEVLPRHRAHIRDLYQRIADEADEVICAIDRLTDLFATRVPTIVRNGTPTLLLDQPVTQPPDNSRLVYVGTLTERFDTQFVDAALEHLPGWRLDLFGTCQYAGQGDSPDAELGDLLTRRRDRVTLHGPVSREQLGGCLDAGDVLIMPHRKRGAVGGDSMKIYDYAARGRPFVTTPWTERVERLVPPHACIVTTPEGFAAAVYGSRDEPRHFAHDRRRWAKANSWDARWRSWEKAVLG